jgi:hypothetical protein
MIVHVFRFIVSSSVLPQESLQPKTGTGLLFTLFDNKTIHCVVALEAG